MLNNYILGMGTFEACIALFALSCAFYYFTQHFKEKEEKEKRDKERLEKLERQDKE